MKHETKHAGLPSIRPRGWGRMLGVLAMMMAAPWAAQAQSLDLSPVEFPDVELGPGLTAEVMQMGINNDATIMQTGASSLGTITQYGANNEAYLQQIGVGNIGNILQIGYGNDVSLKQYLSGGRADLVQIGVNNELNVIQRYTPYVPVTQIGRNLELTLYR